MVAMSSLYESNKDLILDHIIGKMYWHGGTNADNESLKNMEAGYELALALIDSIYDNANIATNAAATHSGQKLQNRAKDMLAYIENVCNEISGKNSIEAINTLLGESIRDTNNSDEAIALFRERVKEL